MLSNFATYYRVHLVCSSVVVCFANTITRSTCLNLQIARFDDRGGKRGRNFLAVSSRAGYGRF